MQLLSSMQLHNGRQDNWWKKLQWQENQLEHWKNHIIYISYICESKNVISILVCDKDSCKEQYIGMTQHFRERIYLHVGSVKSDDSLYAREQEKVLIIE